MATTMQRAQKAAKAINAQTKRTRASVVDTGHEVIAQFPVGPTIEGHARAYLFASFAMQRAPLPPKVGYSAPVIEIRGDLAFVTFELCSDDPAEAKAWKDGAEAAFGDLDIAPFSRRTTGTI